MKESLTLNIKRSMKVNLEIKTIQNMKDFLASKDKKAVFTSQGNRLAKPVLIVS